MSQFDIHKWNADRRKEALNEGYPNKWSVIYTSPRGVESKYYYSSEEEARKSADGIKNFKEKGWKSIVVEPENLNEGVAKFIGSVEDGVIKIMDYAFFSIMADNEEAFNLLMDTLKNATNEEKAEMLTNLSKFKLKPTLMKLAKDELSNMHGFQSWFKESI